jgi:hypothetical protein
LTNVEFPHGLEISQAPHQQTFVISNGKVTADTINMVYQYPSQVNHRTNETQAIQEQPISHFVMPDGVVLATQLAQNVYDFWKSSHGTQLADSSPASALLAHHLASPPARAVHLSFSDFSDAEKQESNLVTTSSLHPKDQELMEDFISSLRVEPVDIITRALEEPITSGPMLLEGQYIVQVYALAYPSSQELSAEGDSRLPHDAKGPLDLVFRLQRMSTENCAVSSLPDKVSIHIPSSPSSGTSDSPHALLKAYDGPGPKIVSTPRYIAAMSTTPSELVITLVSRIKGTAETDLGTKRDRDLSFLLSKVRINARPEMLDTVFVITVREYYAGLGGKGPVVSTARVSPVVIGHQQSIV